MRPEIYKKIKDFESYEVSNYGNVRQKYLFRTV